MPYAKTKNAVCLERDKNATRMRQMHFLRGLYLGYPASTVVCVHDVQADRFAPIDQLLGLKLVVK